MEEKVAKLINNLRELKRVLVAYSGGLDSSYLLAMAAKTLGTENVAAAMANGPSVPKQDCKDAGELAGSLGIKFITVNAGEMSDSEYIKNTEIRCYWCKHNLFKLLIPLAKSMNMVVADGFNVSDRTDWRPGRAAADESGVRHPLDDAGLTKDNIRNGAHALGLALWDKPSSPCLASRLPFGVPVTARALGEIERTEKIVKSFGFKIVRARHYDNMIKIEVGQDELGKLQEHQTRQEIISAALETLDKKMDVVFDEDGYRQGKVGGAKFLAELI